MTDTATQRSVRLRPQSAALGDFAALRQDAYTSFLARTEDESLSYRPTSANYSWPSAFADPLLSDQPLDSWSATSPE